MIMRQAIAKQLESCYHFVFMPQRNGSVPGRTKTQSEGFFSPRGRLIDCIGRQAVYKPLTAA